MNWLDLVNMFAAVFLASLKDGKKKKQIKSIALKVYKSIGTAFAGDPDFQG